MLISLEVGFVRETLPSGIQQTVDFANQLQKPLRILFDRCLCAQRNPGFQAVPISIGLGPMLRDVNLGDYWSRADICPLQLLRVIRISGHATKMPMRRLHLML
ncbi:MAG: hypothetical protein JWQ87_1947 [Candidatus Sulfotelmatobacter sp.]|nr:hypothetical protein [Candidatus Sulfotelmatobacter sp.]